MKKCCFCEAEIEEWGNNPWPFFADVEEAECCDDCNTLFVIGARIRRLDEDTAMFRLPAVMKEAKEQYAKRRELLV